MVKKQKHEPNSTRVSKYTITATTIVNGEVYLKIEENNGATSFYKWIKYNSCSNYSDEIKSWYY